MQHGETTAMENQLSKDLANLQIEYKRLKNLHGKLREEVTTKATKLQDRTSNDDKLKCSQLETEVKELKAEIKELTGMLQKTEHLKTELDAKNDKSNRLDERLRCIEDELRRHKDIHKEVTDKLLVDIAQLKTDNTTQQLAIADIKSICTKTFKHVSQLTPKTNPGHKSIPQLRAGTKTKSISPGKKIGKKT